VGAARRTVRQKLIAWGLSADLVDTAVLVLSELTTNALRHAHSAPGREIGVHVALSADCLRIEVSDAGTGHPRPRTAHADDESGRGLALVAALTTRHGVRPRAGGIGTTVWAEVDIAGPAPARLR
jgi:anti-sigma regulatory factor (Ser/Thr protein kinase)